MSDILRKRPTRFPMAWPAFSALVFLLPAGFPASIQAGSPVAARTEPFAVVELFTSEGCSSCPPADRLLSGMVGRTDSGSRRIFALSFHVDYWNSLGWRDPFSHAEFTARQEIYAEALSTRMYTPQMIVNGSVEFVGSDAARAGKSLDAALSETATSSVVLKAGIGVASRSIKVTAEVEGHQSGDYLNVALVERSVSVSVRRGENGGRTLRHDNVVRSFRSIRMDAGGGMSLSLDLPEGVDVGRLSLIAYVQEVPAMRITGAASAVVPRPK